MLFGNTEALAEAPSPHEEKMDNSCMYVAAVPRGASELKIRKAQEWLKSFAGTAPYGVVCNYEPYVPDNGNEGIFPIASTVKKKMVVRGS